MMKTRFVSLLLVFSMAVGLLAVPVLADETAEGEAIAVSEEAVAAESDAEIPDEPAEVTETEEAGEIYSDVIEIPLDIEEGEESEIVFDGESDPEAADVIPMYEEVFTEDTEAPEDPEVLNGATSISGAVISGLKSVYRVECVNGTYYVDGVKQSSTTNLSLEVRYSIKVGNTYLQKNKDFTASMTLNGFMGAGKVVFTGIGNYTGTKTWNFRWLHAESLYGGDRYSTAAAIAKDWYSSSSDFSEVVLVKGSDFPDALSANAYAGLRYSPLLLTRPNELPPDVRTFLSSYKSKIKQVTFIGGGLTGAQDEVRGLLSGVTVREIAGADRKETAEKVCQAIIDAMGTTATNGAVFVATGANPADALSASPWSYYYSYPILLTDSRGQATDATKELIKKFKKVILLGQEAQVSSNVVSHVTPVRLYGSDRYATSRKVVSYFLSGYQDRIKNKNTAWVTIVSGLKANYPDALVGGQYMMPVILVNDSNASIPNEIKTLKPLSTAGVSVMYQFLGAAGKGKGTMYEKVCKNLES